MNTESENNAGICAEKLVNAFAKANGCYVKAVANTYNARISYKVLVKGGNFWAVGGGPLTFNAQDAYAEVLRKLIEWKAITVEELQIIADINESV